MLHQVIVIAEDDERLLGGRFLHMVIYPSECAKQLYSSELSDATHRLTMQTHRASFIGLIDGISTELAIGVTFGMNLTSVFPEYYAIAKVSYTIILVSQIH